MLMKEKYANFKKTNNKNSEQYNKMNEMASRKNMQIFRIVRQNDKKQYNITRRKAFLMQMKLG